MSIVLGINAFGQNPSACLVMDGKLLSFSHEERFNRIKGADDCFPILAMNWCLASNNLTLMDVDRIAVNWDCTKYPVKILQNLLSYKLSHWKNEGPKQPRGGGGWYGLVDYLTAYTPGHYQQKVYDTLRIAGVQGKIPTLQYIPHHLCHAYQTYYQSDYKNASVLVADGHGEDDCVSGYEVKDGRFKRVMHYPVPYSLGWFYGGFTAYLGFEANMEEGKLMGLAAYGASRHQQNPWLRRLDKVLRVTESGFELEPTYFKMGKTDYHPRFTNALVDFITSYDPSMMPIGYREKTMVDGKLVNSYLQEKYIDLAYAVQTRLDEVLTKLSTVLMKKTGIRNLCLSGGLFMNCKANGTIKRSCNIKNLFVHPASSDDGSSIGAAFYAAKEMGMNVCNPLQHAQLGASYTNDQIINSVKAYGLQYRTCDDIGAEVAALLHQGKFVGWFSGGSEMGARALGGRSIVASPVREKAKDEINAKVKNREMWRPYCPSMNYDSVGQYLHFEEVNPYMNIADTATELLKSVAPAIVHVDDTIRPQTVRQSILPKWYHLIDELSKLNGHAVVLNTSFNVRGEPIVNSPYDAIRTFYASGLHALALEDILIVKENCE